MTIKDRVAALARASSGGNSGTVPDAFYSLDQRSVPGRGLGLLASPMLY